jgi:hypothetical protein
MSSSWGPSPEEIRDTVLSDHQPHWGEPQVFDIGTDISDGEDEGNQEDAELLEAFEASALTEAYHEMDEFSMELSFQGLRVEVDSSEHISQGGSRSPRKRSRVEGRW